MTPKIKNIIIFLGIGIVLILVYVFLIKGSPDQASLTSSSGAAGSQTTSGVADQNSAIAQDFLSLLLNVKSISLNDSIFSDPAFASLNDSSIVLVPDAVYGRPNPFAPIGSDVVPGTAPSGATGTNSGTNGSAVTPPLLGGSASPTPPGTNTTPPPTTN